MNYTSPSSIAHQIVQTCDMATDFLRSNPDEPHYVSIPMTYTIERVMRDLLSTAVDTSEALLALDAMRRTILDHDDPILPVNRATTDVEWIRMRNNPACANIPHYKTLHRDEPAYFLPQVGKYIFPGNYAFYNTLLKHTSLYDPFDIEKALITVDAFEYFKYNMSKLRGFEQLQHFNILDPVHEHAVTRKIDLTAQESNMIRINVPFTTTEQIDWETVMMAQTFQSVYDHVKGDHGLTAPADDMMRVMDLLMYVPIVLHLSNKKDAWFLLSIVHGTDEAAIPGQANQASFFMNMKLLGILDTASFYAHKGRVYTGICKLLNMFIPMLDKVMNANCSTHFNPELHHVVLFEPLQTFPLPSYMLYGHDCYDRSFMKCMTCLGSTAFIGLRPITIDGWEPGKPSGHRSFTSQEAIEVIQGNLMQYANMSDWVNANGDLCQELLDVIYNKAPKYAEPFLKNDPTYQSMFGGDQNG